MTDVSALIVKAQVASVELLQASPVHFENVYPATGMAVSDTEVSLFRFTEQALPQLMPFPETDPPADGTFETMSAAWVVAEPGFEASDSNFMPSRGSVMNELTT